MPLNAPNFLTLSRLLLTPLALVLHTQGVWVISFTILLVATLTDYFDGKVARATGTETDFGAIFDPITDKLTTIMIYSYLLGQDLVPWWLAVAALLRNFSQFLSLPILILWLRRTFTVKPKLFPKVAAAFLSAYCFFPLYLKDLAAPLEGPLSTPLWVLGLVITLMELEILRTYVPRLVQIATGRHNYFE